MDLTKEELKDLLRCVVLILQYHGHNERLENLYEKLRKEDNYENTNK